MKKKVIVENLKLLHGLRVGGEPSSRWIGEARQGLLARVAEDSWQREKSNKWENATQFFGLRDFFTASFRYGGAVAATFVVIFGGWIACASATYASMPGDPLYPLKIVSERAQVALTPSPEDKARLHMEFVGRRVEEIAKLAEKPTVTGNRIQAAVTSLRSDVSSIQQEMTNLKKESPLAAMQVAQYVDKKADQYHSLLDQTDSIGSFATDGAIEEAKNIVVDASVKAVAVIIEGQANGGAAVPQSEVTLSVDQKIKAVEARIASIQQDISTTTPHSVKESADQATVALSTAKNLVGKQDLSGALVKVIESKELVKAAETIVTTNLEAANATALSVGASGTAATATGKLWNGIVTIGLSTSSYPRFVSSTPPTNCVPTTSSSPTP